LSFILFDFYLLSGKEKEKKKCEHKYLQKSYSDLQMLQAIRKRDLFSSDLIEKLRK